MFVLTSSFHNRTAVSTFDVSDFAIHMSGSDVYEMYADDQRIRRDEDLAIIVGDEGILFTLSVKATHTITHNGSTIFNLHL